MPTRSPSWSLLKTQWLDVPAAQDVGRDRLTWGAFSEIFEACLEGVYRRADRHVHDRSSLEGIVTAVLVENLHVLVSPLEERAKLRLLLAATDLVITRQAAAEPRRAGALDFGDRRVKSIDRAGET